MTIRLNKELCYGAIINSYNNPHIASINLLEEIIEQHQLQLIPHSKNPEQKVLYSTLSEGWKVNYKYFKEKYNLEYAQARYALRKLERYNLITRTRVFKSYKPSTKEGGSEIYIKLNLENIKNYLL